MYLLRQLIPGQGQWRAVRDRLSYYVRRLLRTISPATRPGMGAVPHADGVTFRVWAPHADQVFVSGDFNRWSTWRAPLAHEANGYWSANIARARVGDAYKFVVRNGDQTLLRTDPYARVVVPPHNNGVIVSGQFDWGAPDETAYQPPNWNELIIYELHIGTFHVPAHVPAKEADTDPARDAAANHAATTIGTFRTARDKLPYLKELGVTAIELMPVQEFAGDYSWGYNPAHPFAVTQTYGGHVALKELVNAAHAHGIAVILDVVYNHFGPQGLDLWRFDGWYENDKGGIYFYNDWRAKTPWADTRPDYGRPEVRQYIRDNVVSWLEEYHVDGLRWDATSYIRNAHGHDSDPGADIAEGWALLRWVNDEAHARYPGRIQIAEDMQDNAWITKETAQDGAGFDAQWDARFVHAVRQAIIAAHDEARDMAAVRDAIALRNHNDAFARVLFTESHDEVANGNARVPEEIAPGQADTVFAKKRSVLGAVMVMTAPGIPLLFQGQEFLESGWFDDHVPLDWRKAQTHAGIVALYRDLIGLRRNVQGVTRGLLGQHINVHHVDNDAKLIAFHRWDAGGPGDDVIVVLNFANRTQPGYTIGFPHPGLWRVRFNSDEGRYAAEFDDHRCPDVVAAAVPGVERAIDGMPYWGNLTLAPYAALILSQE